MTERTARRLGAVTAAVTLMVSGAVLSAPAEAQQPCRAKPAAGGEWRSGGHDLSNTRSQPQENAIGTTTAGQLEVAWHTDLNDATGDTQPNATQTTPVVSGGCVVVTKATGWVVALDAATGATVWATGPDAIPSDSEGVGTDVNLVGTPVVDGGHVFVALNQKVDEADPATGPYLASLDVSTGQVAWHSAPIDRYTTTYKEPPRQAGDTLQPSEGTQSFVQSSPVVYRGMVLIGFSTPELDPGGHGGFAIFDERTGQLLAHTLTVPDDRTDQAGGGLWATPVVDEVTGYAYVGTANPYTRRHHPNTDAIVKIDLDRSRPTFGQIVASAPGTPESYVAGLDQQPACDAAGNDLNWPHPGGVGLLSGSVACVELDFDFGASPNLMRLADGRTLVGDLQKSGVYHAVDASTMTEAWSATVASPEPASQGSTAFDGKAVFGMTPAPSTAFALESGDGAARWKTPQPESFHAMGTAVANGVVYTLDSNGTLWCLDAATGLVLASRSVPADAGTGALPAYYTGSYGVSIAANHVYVAMPVGDTDQLPAATPGPIRALYGELRVVVVAYQLPNARNH